VQVSYLHRALDLIILYPSHCGATKFKRVAEGVIDVRSLNFAVKMMAAYPYYPAGLQHGIPYG